MRSRLPSWLWLALLLIGPIAVTAIAYASPPDPSWIGGIYDDADYDDVVTLATSATGDLAPALIDDLQSAPPLIGSIPRLVDTRPFGPAPSAVRSRAPPVP
jgi:hypothetical protein